MQKTPESTNPVQGPDTGGKLRPMKAGPTNVAVRVWTRPMTVGHIYASCLVFRIWLIAREALPASESCMLSFDGNERYRRFSARAQSATKRRASYLSPAIVSAFGTTVFEISPIAHSRESGRSSGGMPQLVLSRIFSLYTGTL